MNKSIVKFDLQHYSVNTAVDVPEKTAGLEVVTTLGEHEGMLFPFECPQYVTFHMGKVQFPIDIIFIEENSGINKVSKIVHNVQPGDCGIWSESNTKYVLEVNGGQCKFNNINVGSSCTILDVVSLHSVSKRKNTRR